VTALQQGVSPDAVFDTSPYTVQVSDGQWHVENYEGAFPDSEISLREATVFSVNAVYARLVMRIGPGSVVETARGMGITSPLEPHPAIALGGLTEGVSPLEMAASFGTIAAGGIRRAPTGVARVTDDTGEVVWEPGATEVRVITEAVAGEVSGILHDVVERGTGMAADFGGWAAGKTGTTQSYRDAWFVGYGGDLVSSVWVGYPEAQIGMSDVRGIKVSGGTFPAEIWRRFMSDVVTGSSGPPRPDDTEADSSGSVTVRICKSSRLLAKPACPDVVDVTLPEDRVPQEECDEH